MQLALRPTHILTLFFLTLTTTTSSSVYAAILPLQARQYNLGLCIEANPTVPWDITGVCATSAGAVTCDGNAICTAYSNQCTVYTGEGSSGLANCT